MNLWEEFKRLLASILIRGAQELTPETDTQTHIAIGNVCLAMIADDKARGIKFREVKRS